LIPELLVKIEALTHIYSPGTLLERKALNEVSLWIEDGEWIGIIGDNGSGKTTLGQHLIGLLKPTSGRIVIGGMDGGGPGLSRAPLRHYAGMVFQNPEQQFFEETVFDEISFVLRRQGDLSTNEIRTKVLSCCAILGLDIGSLASRSPFELSGGEMRRVALASILVQNPQMLILDEPTTGLDALGRQRILQSIDLLHRTGKTVILIAHEIEDLLGRASRFIFMDQGKILFSGLPSEMFLFLLQDKKYHRFISSTFRLLQGVRKAGWKIPMEVVEVEAALPYLDRYLKEVYCREEGKGYSRG
jgi:energy-coupling factor transport system ATP-binding protein